MYDQTSSGTPGGTLNGTTVNYSTPLGVNTVAGLQAYRADVTSIVQTAVAAATSNNITFNVTETNGSQDGEALVVVYSNPALPTQTVAILNGFSASAGDSSSITFSSPLNPSAPGFLADLRIGDGFSYDGTGCTGSDQVSLIKVNNTPMTNVAGCNDDSVDATPNNGNLITIGGDFDPYTPFVSGGENVTASDHERYNLTPYLTTGETTINLSTLNPSGDDNIFLETFVVSGSATVTTGSPVPEPGTLSLLAVGAAGLLTVGRRRRRA